MLSVFVIKLVAFLIMIALVGFAGVLWVNASRLEQEIKAELNRPGEE